MAPEAKDSKKQAPAPSKPETFSGKERFERRQLAKRNAVENNPDAIVFIPESPIARQLVNAIMTVDSIDGIMRQQAGLIIDFKDFEQHITQYQALTKSLEETGAAMLDLIAKNDKIQPRFIRNRFTRRAVEDARKAAKKAEPDTAKSKSAKEGEPEAPKK